MGEIAEMMLDGTLCGGCGVYLHGNGQGFQRFCQDCTQTESRPSGRGRVSCPQCGRRVKFVGLADHKRDAHGGAA